MLELTFEHKPVQENCKLLTDVTFQTMFPKESAYFAAFQTALTISLVKAQSVYTPLIETCLSQHIIRLEGII